MTNKLEDVDSKLVQAILKKYSICKYCVIRQLSHIKTVGTSTLKIPGIDICCICKGLMSNLDSLADRVITKLSGYEYNSFQVGATLPTESFEIEDRLRSDFKLKGGRNLKREVGYRLTRIIADKTGKQIMVRNPNVTVHVKPLSEEIDIYPRSVHIYGRYVKKTRGLQQRKRNCSSCYGKGCTECDYTGKSEEASVEDILIGKILKHFEGRRVKITWIGSEDPDSLVLGGGRPFYAEILEPKIRNIVDFQIFNHNENISIQIVELFEEKRDYTRKFVFESDAHVSFEHRVTKVKLSKLSTFFNDRVVELQPVGTDKTLTKKIHNLTIETSKGLEAKIRIRCDGGVSIKGLVGDPGFGRSVIHVSPNISEVIGMNCKCDYFDVIDIDY